MRKLAFACAAGLLAFAGGTASAQSTESGASWTSQANTPEHQRFVAQYDAETRSCIDGCIASSTVVGTMGAPQAGGLWTLDQFSSRYDGSTRMCIQDCVSRAKQSQPAPAQPASSKEKFGPESGTNAAPASGTDAASAAK